MWKKVAKLTCTSVLAITASSLLAQDLSVWHTENDRATIAALDTIARRFEAENPGVKVQMLSVGWDDLYRKLTLAIQSRDVPVVTQIEPFMAAYLYNSGQLQPLDDIVETLNKTDIFPAVLDLQKFDGKRYGIATALGISYYSFRRDFLRDVNAVLPRTWSEYSSFLRTNDSRKVAPLLLPANDLHLTLLFTELLASNGGSYFDAGGNPDFNNPRVIETLRFWSDLFHLVPKDLQNSPYSENFAHYAQGRAFSLPGFFGRGILQIERTAPQEQRSPDDFDMFPHIVGPSGTKAYATLDAEPWVILKGSPRPDLARRFLRFFYQKENYLLFCTSVPVHLTPILRSLATGTEYTSVPLVQKWRRYHDYEIKLLDADSVLPIFMARKQDRLNSSLFKLEGSRIISGMIRDVTLNNLSPEKAVEVAMSKAAQLTQGLPKRPASTVLTRFAWAAGGLAILTLAALVIRFSRRKGNAA